MDLASAYRAAMRDKIDRSRNLAEMVQQALYAGVAAPPVSMPNRGVKSAPFVVLLGASMPSVLAEVSFISSPEDERKLSDNSFRQQIADALYRGVAGYIQTMPRSPTGTVNRLVSLLWIGFPQAGWLTAHGGAT